MQKLEKDNTGKVTVNRVDCTGETFEFDTVKEAEHFIGELAKKDPEGVDRGDYSIDVPEEMQ